MNELVEGCIACVLLAGILFLIVYGDQWVLTRSTVWQVVFTVLCILFGGIVFVELWVRAILWARGTQESLRPGDRLGETVWMVGLPTVAFAALTTLLVQHGWLLSASGSEKPGLAYASSETYLWSLVNAIPILDLSNAFDWHPQFRLLHESGRLFVLAYKLAIIVPLVYWLRTFTLVQRPPGVENG